MVNARFPHVGDLIKRHWAEPKFMDFLRELLAPDPKRQGFPTVIISALHSLALEHFMETQQDGSAATPVAA
jgi:hypothetical protein